MVASASDTLKKRWGEGFKINYYVAAKGLRDEILGYRKEKLPALADKNAVLPGSPDECLLQVTWRVPVNSGSEQ